MITPIIINTQDIVSQFTSLTPDDVSTMLDNIAKGLTVGFANQLEEEAKRALNKTRKRYIDSIKVVDSGKAEGTVLLDYSKDKLIQMIEDGASPFDMKKFFLSSPKVKTGKKGGKYLTIPFRWGTPGSLGESDVFAFQLPKAIYKIVKAKPLTIPVSGGGSRSAGISFKEIPDAFKKQTSRESIKDEKGSEIFKEYQHRTNIYQGVVKKQDNATGQNTYRSFRRVSENSDPDAFIHPGIEKYNLIQKALGEYNVQNNLSLLIDNELSKLGLI